MSQQQQQIDSSSMNNPPGGNAAGAPRMNAGVGKELTPEEAALFVHDRGTLFKALRRNNYFIPESINDPFLSWTFMEGVRQGDYWLPKTSEIRYFDVVDPPTRPDLAAMVVENMQAIINDPNGDEKLRARMAKTCDRMKRVPPNAKFMLCLLGTLNPGHEVFGKDYQRPRKTKKAAEAVVVSNADGFFDGLPQAKAGNKKGPNRIGRRVETKEEKLQRKVREMEEKKLQQQAKWDLRIQNERAEHEEQELYRQMIAKYELDKLRRKAAREAASGLTRNQTANTGLIGNHGGFSAGTENPLHSARGPATTRAPADVPLHVSAAHNDMSAHSHREPMQPQTGIGAAVLIQQRINMRSEDPAGLANSRHNPSRVVDDDLPDDQQLRVPPHEMTEEAMVLSQRIEVADGNDHHLSLVAAGQPQPNVIGNAHEQEEMGHQQTSVSNNGLLMQQNQASTNDTDSHQHREARNAQRNPSPPRMQGRGKKYKDKGGNSKQPKGADTEMRE